MLVIMGTFRVAEEHIAALLPLARKVAEATRAEPGCIPVPYPHLTLPTKREVVTLGFAV